MGNGQAIQAGRRVGNGGGVWRALWGWQGSGQSVTLLKGRQLGLHPYPHPGKGAEAGRRDPVNGQGEMASSSGARGSPWNASSTE